MKNQLKNSLSKGLRILLFVSFFSLNFACSQEEAVAPDVIKKSGTLNTDPGEPSSPKQPVND